MSKQRQQYSAAYKFKVALAAAGGDKTLSKLARECQLSSIVEYAVAV